MSGGVDSSVAALLAVGLGLDCAGAMMKLYPENNNVEDPANTGSSPSNIEDARAIANKLGIPFHISDFTDEFREQVISRFIQVYLNGETPNPCISCNRYLKFDCLFKLANELDKQFIVTGHYARAEVDTGSGRMNLKKGLDTAKDQSYVLYTLTQEKLRHTLFPLGAFTKSQVRQIALEHGFTNAKKHESQDICFVMNGDYADFIQKNATREIPEGRFVDISGNDLGKNKGIIHYTVGQRRGLGLSAAEPLYVCSIDAKNNTIVVGPESNLYAKRLIARDINLIPVDKLDSAIKTRARVRYNQQEQAATAWQLDEDTLQVEFETPQRAIAKGQAVVLYDGDTVIGGGTINEVC